MEDSKDLIEALGYVDYILNEEGYETWCEARCTIARAKKQIEYLNINKDELYTAFKFNQKRAEELEKAGKNILESYSYGGEVPTEWIEALTNLQKLIEPSKDASQSEVSANG